MKLLGNLKSITWSLRRKIARAISSHDLRTVALLDRERLRIEEKYRVASEERDLARHQAAAAQNRGNDFENRFRASEQFRLEAQQKLTAATARVEELTRNPVESFCRALREGEAQPAWDAAAGCVDVVIEKLVRPFHKSVSLGDRLLTLDKSMSFAKDAVFREVFNQFRGLHPYDQYSSPENITWRLNTLLWAAREALSLDGDFVECGVFKGDMSYTIARCLGFEKIEKTFFLYDSFEGYSPKYSSPADFPLNPRFLDVANAAYRIPNLYENVCARFAGYSNFKIVKGFLPDTLSIAAPEKLSFLHIDLNSPAAEVGTLDVLFDRVVPNGIVVFDDYGWIDFAPQKEAEDAFFAARGYRVLELPTGQGLVVKR